MERAVPAAVECQKQRQRLRRVRRIIRQQADRVACRAGIIAPVVGGGGDFRDKDFLGHAQGGGILLPGKNAAPALETAPEFRAVRAEIRFVPHEQEIAGGAQRLVTQK